MIKGRVEMMRLISKSSTSSFLIISLIAFLLLKGALAQIPEKKIVMIVPLKDFWCEELTKPKEIFEQSGLLVTIASSAMREAKSIFGVIIKPDVVLNEVRVAHYDAIIFVGGEGAVQYWDDTHAHRLVKEAIKERKVLGAISIAPIILANTKVLTGRRATVWPTLGKRLEWSGAIYTGNPVEVDGNIVTANSPESAEEFAKSILKIILRK
jgi:protease I